MKQIIDNIIGFMSNEENYVKYPILKYIRGILFGIILVGVRLIFGPPTNIR